MRLIIIVLFVIMLATSVWAGMFKDNFNDGNFEGWLETFAGKPANSVWKVQNGVLVGKRSSGWGAHLTIGDASKWDDYTVECDMKPTERILNEWGGDFHYAGIVGHLRPNNVLITDATGILLNFKVASTVWEFAVERWNDQKIWLRNNQTPFNVKLDDWYHLKFVVTGANFKLYADNSLVASFNNGAVPTGRVGVAIGGCVAEFDNIIIKGDDVPDVGPSGYAVHPKSKLTTAWGRLKNR